MERKLNNKTLSPEKPASRATVSPRQNAATAEKARSAGVRSPRRMAAALSAVMLLALTMLFAVLPAGAEEDARDELTFYDQWEYANESFMDVLDADQCQLIMDAAYHYYQCGMTGGYIPAALLRSASTNTTMQGYIILMMPPDSHWFLGARFYTDNVNFNRTARILGVSMSQGFMRNYIYSSDHVNAFTSALLYSSLPYGTAQRFENLKANSVETYNGSILYSTSVGFGDWYVAYVPSVYHPVLVDEEGHAYVATDEETVNNPTLMADAGTYYNVDTVMHPYTTGSNNIPWDEDKFLKYTNLAKILYSTFQGGNINPDEPVTDDLYKQGFIAGQNNILNNPNESGLYNRTQYQNNYEAGKNDVLDNLSTYNLITAEYLDEAVDDAYDNGVAQVRNHPNTYDLYTQLQYEAYGDTRYNDGLINGNAEGGFVMLDLPAVITAVPTGFRNLLVHSFDFDFFGINAGGLLLFVLGAFVIIGVIKFLKKG